LSILGKERDVAIQAARAAGKIVSENYGRLKESDIGEKGVNDMVTTIDLRSQELVVDAIRANFPDDFIVAEESLPDSVNAGRDPEGARRWYIDPLDGTTNYIHSYPMFAVNVALEVDGVMTLGVTFAPFNNEMFHAVRGDGAFLNDAKMSVSTIEAKNRMLLGTGFPFRARHHLELYLSTFAYFFNNARGLRRAGSAALDLAYVAAGRLDGFWEMTLASWDMAPGLVLIQEAGGQISDFFGGNKFLTDGHIVATNGLFHDWMCEELSRLIPADTDLNLRS